MAMQTIAAFLIVVQTRFLNAADVDIPLASAWAQPSRAQWCPVHVPFSISAANGNTQFAPPGRGAFSLAETSISLPSATASSGLRLRLSAAGSTMPSFWRFALTHSTSGRRRRKVRFVAPVEVPSGGVERTVVLPWASFLGQRLYAGGSSACTSPSDASGECAFRPEIMTHLSIIWSRKGGVEEPSLILHELVATGSTTVPASTLSATMVPASGDNKCSCDVDCVHCTALSWAPLVSQSCDSSTTSDMCLSVRRSLAERVVAGLGGRNGSCSVPGAQDAVRWLTSALDVSNCMADGLALPAKLLGDVLQAVFSVALPGQTAACQSGGTVSLSTADDFVGPFVGWGITGYNDIELHKSETASSCLEKCRAEPRCKSVDYGARDGAQGQCWLSTANRITADQAYSNKWYLYDYYERATASKDTSAVNTGSMANALSTSRREELLKDQRAVAACCASPIGCIDRAISVGAPLYNGGDHLGCAFIYHATAKKLADCPAMGTTGNKFPDVRGVMQATADMSMMDGQPGHAAWRLRDAFDSYYIMLQNPQADQCMKVEPVALSTAMTTNVLSNSKDALSNTTTKGVPGQQSQSRFKSPSGTSASGAMSALGGSMCLAGFLPLSMLVFAAGVY